MRVHRCLPCFIVAISAFITIISPLSGRNTALPGQESSFARSDLATEREQCGVVTICAVVSRYGQHVTLDNVLARCPTDVVRRGIGVDELVAALNSYSLYAQVRKGTFTKCVLSPLAEGSTVIIPDIATQHLFTYVKVNAGRFVCLNPPYTVYERSIDEVQSQFTGTTVVVSPTPPRNTVLGMPASLVTIFGLVLFLILCLGGFAVGVWVVTRRRARSKRDINASVATSTWMTLSVIAISLLPISRSMAVEPEGLSQEYNLGTVQPGKEYRKSFKVTNPYDTAVLIKRIVPSCGCTDVSMPERRIEPGGTVAVDVTIKINDSDVGPFSHTIAFVDDIVAGRVLRIIVSGMAPSDDRLISASRSIYLGSVLAGSQIKHEFYVERVDHSPVLIESADVNESHMHLLSISPLRPRANRYYFTLTLDSLGMPPGPITGQITVKTKNGKNSELHIPIEGRIDSDFYSVPARLFLGAVPAQISAWEARVISRPGKQIRLFNASQSLGQEWSIELMENGVRLRLDKSPSVIAKGLVVGQIVVEFGVEGEITHRSINIPVVGVWADANATAQRESK